MVSKHKYIRRIIVVYLCVLIPVIAFSLLIAQVSFQQAKQREERIMTQILQDIAGELERWYMDFGNQAATIGERPELSPSIVLNSAVDEQKAVKQLSFAKLFSDCTKEIAVCYGNNQVYTSRGKTSVPVYFNTTLNCTAESAEAAKEALAKDNACIILLETNSADDLLMFHQPIRYTRFYETSVQFIVSLEQISDVMEASDSQYTLCMDVSGKKVYFQLQDGKCIVLRTEDFAAVEEKQNCVLTTNLAIPGMELALSFDPAESWTEFRHFQMVYLCLMVVGIALSVLLSFVLSGHRWKRFQNLTNRFAVDPKQDSMEFKDEFEYIRIMLEQSQQDCESAEQNAQSYRQAMLRQATSMIFRGIMNEPEAVQRTLQSYCVKITKDYFYLCGVVLEEHDTDITKFENLLSGYLYCDAIFKEKRVLILLADSETLDQDLAERLEMVNWLCRQMLISKQTVCRVVLSQVYTQLSMVNNAYCEISQLLESPLLPEEFIECWDQQVISDQLTTEQLEQLAKFIESLEKRELHETEQILQAMTGTDDRESGQLENPECEHEYAVKSGESEEDRARCLRYCVRQAMIQVMRRNNSGDARLMEEILSVNPDNELHFEEQMRKILQAYCVEDEKREQIEALIEYVQQNYARCDLSKEEVSAQVGINKTQMSKLFKEELGMGYLDYLTKLRMDKAKYLLLHTDESVKNILQAVGYIDQTSFTKKFKTYYGMSPTEFRNQRQSEKSSKQKRERGELQ